MNQNDPNNFSEDVTPPSLQWNRIPPSQTAGNMTLSWTTSEAVTSVCIVQSPVQLITVSCNNSWIGAKLRNGNYALTVKMVDGSGNAAEYVHRWKNSKEFSFSCTLTHNDTVKKKVERTKYKI